MSNKTMRAIQVTKWGEAPVFNPTASTPDPAATSDHVQVRVLAAGLHQLVRAQAAGKHYSTNPATTPVPYTPGSDGVGTTPDGQLVYFSSVATGGAFAEFVTLPKSAITMIPNTNSNNPPTDQRKLAARIAVLFNPAMSSWMALHTRVTPSILQQEGGFNLLIIGATSLSGHIAIKHARHLGARTIIGLARNTTTMHTMDIDIPIKIEDDPTKTVLSPIMTDPGTRIDVILDFLYGPITLHVLNSLPSNAATAHDTATEYIEIGAITTNEMTLPGSLLRSKNLTLRGAGYGSWSMTKDAATWFPGLLERLADEKDFGTDQFPNIVERRLEDVDAAWADSSARSVFIT